MAEAAIGLSLMAFVFIMVVYVFFMGDYQIRTEMAARYAAWYAGATGGSSPSTSQVDSNFFYQSNLSTVPSPAQGEGLLSPFTGGGTNASTASAFTNNSGGPYLVTVTFGVTDPNATTNPYPFNLLNNVVLFQGWTNTMFANFYSVSSHCQWDDISDTWSNANEVFSGIESMAEQAFSKLP